MSTPEAIRLAVESDALADEQECIHLASWVHIRNLLRADSAELRRLSALNAELVEGMKKLLRHFTKTPSTLNDSEARGAAHALIAKAEGGAA